MTENEFDFSEFCEEFAYGRDKDYLTRLFKLQKRFVEGSRGWEIVGEYIDMELERLNPEDKCHAENEIPKKRRKR